MNRSLATTATLALLATLTGCGADDAAGGDAPGAAADGAYPVTVDSCGEDLTVDRAPTRAVTNDINAFEYMAALELEPSMIGTFGLKGFGPDGQSPVPTAYQAAYDAVPAVSPDYVTLEPLVGLSPDFLFAGYNYGLKVGTPMTPQSLATYDVATYALRESCAHVQPEKTDVGIEDTYADLTALGAVFGVPERAEALVEGIRAQVAGVEEAVAGAEPVSVFLYDGGTDAPFTAPGLAMPDALIEAAGGRNIFHDLQETWTTVSWEQVVAGEPECIVVNDYGTPTYDEKVAFLESDPRTRDLPAVQDDCYVHLSYGQLTPSPDNGDAVEEIARVLHPDRT